MYNSVSYSKRTLAHTATHRPETSVHLSRRRAEDEGDDCVARNLDVLEGAHDVDFGVGKYDARAARVLDGEFGFAILAGDATYGAGKMVSMKGFDIFDLE